MKQVWRIHKILGVSILALAAVGQANAQEDVDLSTWTAESYPAVAGFGAGVWTVAGDNRSVYQSVNGQPTLFYSDFLAFNTSFQGKIRVETTGDDDFVGFALGFQPGDASNSSADYLLVDWKQGNQSFNFGSPSCTPGSFAPRGLAVSRVTGIPTADEFWGHTNFNSPACSDLNSGLQELQGGAALGSTGWADFREYEFKFEFSATSLKVFVDGILEIDITGSFSDGRIAFYNFSQSCVRYSGFTVAPLCEPVEDPDVRTQGFWKHICDDPGHPSGEHDNLPNYVDAIKDSATFVDVADVADLCDRLNPNPMNDKCEQAEAQFMALLLNLASGRVAVCNCIDDPDLGLTTVGDAASFIDGLLSNPGRTFEDCVMAQVIADDINNGATLVDCGGGCTFTTFCDTNALNVTDITFDGCDCSAGSINVCLVNAAAFNGNLCRLLVGSSIGVVVNPPGSIGNLCIVGGCLGIYGLDVGTISAGTHCVDVLNAASGGGGGNVPTCGGNLCVPAGQTWIFQFWLDDGPNPSRFSKALSVTFQ